MANKIIIPETIKVCSLGFKVSYDAILHKTGDEIANNQYDSLVLVIDSSYPYASQAMGFLHEVDHIIYEVAGVPNNDSTILNMTGEELIQRTNAVRYDFLVNNLIQVKEK